jgi:hypothetical protein
MAVILLFVGSLFSIANAWAQEKQPGLSGPSHGLVARTTEDSGLPSMKNPNFSYFQAKSVLIKLCVSLDDVQGVLDKMEPGRYRASPFPPCGDDGKATLLGMDAAIDRVFDFGNVAGVPAIVGPTTRFLAFGLGTDTKGTDDPSDDAKGLLQLAIYSLAPGPLNQALGVPGLARSATIKWQIETDSSLGTAEAFYGLNGADGFAFYMHVQWPMDPADRRAPAKPEFRQGAGSPRIYFAGAPIGGQHPSIEFEYVRNRLDIHPNDFGIEVLPSDQLGFPAGDISILSVLGASVTRNQESLIKVYLDDAP